MNPTLSGAQRTWRDLLLVSSRWKMTGRLTFVRLVHYSAIANLTANAWELIMTRDVTALKLFFYKLTMTCSLLFMTTNSWSADLHGLGFERVIAKETGRPSYHLPDLADFFPPPNEGGLAAQTQRLGCRSRVSTVCKLNLTSPDQRETGGHHNLSEVRCFTILLPSKITRN